MFQDVGADATRTDVMLAILFHDIIYWPDRRDNERKSADFFLAEMPETFKANNAELVQVKHFSPFSRKNHHKTIKPNINGRLRR
jgi:predicted metal-dependent HD superfamily phosphohydrolase